jgi:hypothetical protein
MMVKTSMVMMVLVKVLTELLQVSQAQADNIQVRPAHLLLVRTVQLLVALQQQVPKLAVVVEVLQVEAQVVEVQQEVEEVEVVHL